MMQFCGQHNICGKFNNIEAMELAKENVIKYYKVVGKFLFPLSCNLIIFFSNLTLQEGASGIDIEKGWDL